MILLSETELGSIGDAKIKIDVVKLMRTDIGDDDNENKEEQVETVND